MGQPIGPSEGLRDLSDTMHACTIAADDRCHYGTSEGVLLRSLSHCMRRMARGGT